MELFAPCALISIADGTVFKIQQDDRLARKRCYVGFRYGYMVGGQFR